ncbi:putative tyrosine aminotransferase [Trypanosoma theileri]|uniref:Putative tyrosine aminotransferase n=1 Tax=Trypanosoma theileri TaxID=67003 RepID=A0A1X0NDS5_9TRYP|nr:putative tyrosine aminotransferase [Trypanosoma theileri]ORC81574.1 putative tyrosine aminotransferase [Trypanosoma theileri]
MTRPFRDLAASKRSLRCNNELFSLVHMLNEGSASAPAGKSLISLAIGDPAVDGNFLPPDELIKSVVEGAKSTLCNNYPSCAGETPAREAVAKYLIDHFAPNMKGIKIPCDNVFICSGSSDALSISIGVLCNPGDNILLPAPYFAHYGTLCRYYDVTPKFYRCDPAKEWEIDLDHLRSLVDDRTRAVLMNNPSNPCGSNFSRKHLEDFLRVCECHHLPVIADEIYAGMVFKGQDPNAVFTSVADIDTSVPRLVVGGISKRFSVPGYRLGWVVLLDREGYAARLPDAMECLLTRCLLPHSVLMHALPNILANTPKSYFEESNTRLEKGAIALYEALRKCPGLRPTRPCGGMFIAVQLVPEELEESVRNDVAFARRLAEEENVQVFPGVAFKMESALRITVSRPLPLLMEAASRIEAFCQRHSLRK